MNVVGGLIKWVTQTPDHCNLGKQSVDFYSKYLYNTHINSKNTMLFAVIFNQD